MEPRPPLRPVASVLELIGRTPLVEARRLDAGPCRLFLKLECWNPGGSIKDRIALSMIEAAEADGRLRPGGVIVEATAGNTGLGLAQVGLPKGYRLILVVPDKMSREKVQHLRALGAEVRITRSDVGKGHPEYYQDMAARIAAETPGGFYIDQFGNPANPLAHERTTGPEIFAALDGDVDAIVVGVGSGGTLTGVGRYFRAVSPKTRMILADPVGSVLAPYVAAGELIEPGSWTVEGIGEDFIPPNADLSLVSEAFSISDRESMEAARLLLAREGVLAGSSSGTLLAAALKWCRRQTEPKTVVSFVCDTGARYLSKVYNDVWLIEEGLASRALHGDLRDLIARSHRDGAAVTTSPDDTLLTAWRRMRAADVSQLPVVEGSRLVGLLDESDLLAALGDDGRSDPARSRNARFAGKVASAMSTTVRTLQASEPITALLPLFERGDVALVLDGTEFLGVVTRLDLINHARLAS